MSTATLLSRALQERLDSARQLTDSIFSLLTARSPLLASDSRTASPGLLPGPSGSLRLESDLPQDAGRRLASVRSSTRCSNSASIRRWAKPPPINPPIGRVSKKFKAITGASARASTSCSIRRPSRSFTSRSNIGSCTPRRSLTCCTTCLTIKNPPLRAHLIYSTDAPGQSDDRNRARRRHARAESAASSAGTTNSTEHQVNVPGFRVSKYKITNGQYLDFVEQGAPAPHFWTRRGDRLVLSRHVLRNPAAAERSGLCHARGGGRLRALARQATAHRAAVSSRGL